MVNHNLNCCDEDTSQQNFEQANHKEVDADSFDVVEEIEIPFSEDFPELVIPVHITNRTAAREFVLQVLYASEVSEQSAHHLMRLMCNNRKFHEKAKQFVEQLLEKIVIHNKQVSVLIKKYSKNWSLNRIAMVDRLAMQIAITEILFFDEIPPKVSISQAIEIVQNYSTEESKRFVNGILDAIYNDSNCLGGVDAE